MSFHTQRLANRLFNTKKPASAYDFHYAFAQKRGVKEEEALPAVETIPLNERNLDEIIKNTEISNWRLVEHRKDHLSNLYGRTLGQILMALLMMIQLTHKRHNAKYNKALGASGVSDLGASYYQDLLE